jgi:opacity protein-like surface antigen
MKRIFTAGVILAALAFSAAAQDWYHDRDERYHGNDWRPHVFQHVRTDLDHIWSAGRASDKERTRIERTKEELTQMQADLNQGRWDNGILNDVIDSIRKSSNDDRLAHRDRAVLADDVTRLKEFQDQHNHRN